MASDAETRARLAELVKQVAALGPSPPPGPGPGPSPPPSSSNIDGGSAASVFTPPLAVDGGSA